MLEVLRKFKKKLPEPTIGVSGLQYHLPLINNLKPKVGSGDAINYGGILRDGHAEIKNTGYIQVPTSVKIPSSYAVIVCFKITGTPTYTDGSGTEWHCIFGDADWEVLVSRNKKFRINQRVNKGSSTAVYGNTFTLNVDTTAWQLYAICLGDSLLSAFAGNTSLRTVAIQGITGRTPARFLIGNLGNNTYTSNGQFKNFAIFNRYITAEEFNTLAAILK